VLPEVVLVHGLWYRSWSLRPTGKHLQKAGFSCSYFNYPTWIKDPVASTGDLLNFCRSRQAQTLHLVGHSLGGLLIIKMLEELSENDPGLLPPGRVVLLGSPLGGSSVARKITRAGVGRIFLNHSRNNLIDGVDYLPGDRECGMIAGNRPRGLGRITGALEGPNDGTVAVSETAPGQLNDHIVLPLSHTGLLFSSDVAFQTRTFLQTGSFNHPGLRS
jgi:pimeloyl-ACP methyl ester carboxylesterase